MHYLKYFVAVTYLVVTHWCFSSVNATSVYMSCRTTQTSRIVVKKVELEMVWEQSYLNPHKFITHVWVGLGKSSCVQIYVTALLPALSLLFDIAMLVPLLAD